MNFHSKREQIRQLVLEIIILFLDSRFGSNSEFESERFGRAKSSSERPNQTRSRFLRKSVERDDQFGDESDEFRKRAASDESRGQSD